MAVHYPYIASIKCNLRTLAVHWLLIVYIGRTATVHWEEWPFLCWALRILAVHWLYIRSTFRTLDVIVYIGLEFAYIAYIACSMRTNAVHTVHWLYIAHIGWTLLAFPVYRLYIAYISCTYRSLAAHCVHWSNVADIGRILAHYFVHSMYIAYISCTFAQRSVHWTIIACIGRIFALHWKHWLLIAYIGHALTVHCQRCQSLPFNCLYSLFIGC